MGWAFYELSGGADFVPQTRVVAQADVAVEVVEAAPVVVAAGPEVTPERTPESAENPVVLASLSDTVPQEAIAPAPPPTPAPFQEAAEALDNSLIESFIASIAEAPVDAGEVATIPEPAQDIRYVTARSLNVRSGPSTTFEVVDRLAFGEATLVLTDSGNGWVEIRIEGDGVIGYTASRFLTSEEPNG